MKCLIGRVALAVALSGCIAGATGCHRSTENLGSNTQTFPIKGVVLAGDPATGEITLQHEAIPGFMEAMTMPYKLQRPEIIKEFSPGDVIRARLVVDKLPDGSYRSAYIDEIVILAQKNLNMKPASNYHAPAAGDAVPDFSFIDQDGHALRLSQLKGKTVLLTFIYTRCPLSDFCPKMSRNLQQIQSQMQSNKALMSKTHFLSVSFDPAFDTPQVLRVYGKNYVGNAGFEHWQFVRTKDDETLKVMEQFFNVGVTPEQNASLTHSLSTVMIDPQGRIAMWYPGSEWTPKEVLEKLQTIAGK